MSSTPVSFILLREGTSDDGLLTPLRQLVARTSTSKRAVGDKRAYTGTVENKLRAFLSEGTPADVVFVHRDADDRNPAPRFAEIAAAKSAVSCAREVVAIVPVQATEAWLLVDEAAIREAVGRPSGTSPLGLPKLTAIENLSDPKAALQDALRLASQTTGRRRRNVNRSFSDYRQRSLQRLDIDGPLASLPSWQRLEADVAACLQTLGL